MFSIPYKYIKDSSYFPEGEVVSSAGMGWYFFTVSDSNIVTFDGESTSKCKAITSIIDAPDEWNFRDTLAFLDFLEKKRVIRRLGYVENFNENCHESIRYVSQMSLNNKSYWKYLLVEYQSR